MITVRPGRVPEGFDARFSGGGGVVIRRPPSVVQDQDHRISGQQRKTMKCSFVFGKIGLLRALGILLNAQNIDFGLVGLPAVEQT